MSNSLKDQLLGVGLVDAKKAKAVSKEIRKQQKVAGKGKKAVSDTQVAVLNAQQEKAERDRELNRQRNLEAEKKAVAAQIAQIVEHYKLPRAGGELDYNFTDGTKIKKIRVTPGLSAELVRGRLCIVRVGETYEVLPKPVAEKIRERDASAVVVYNDATLLKAQSSSDDDDYYAQFEIPDDLMW
jgi:uncharacterized protein YaiL (DUF2058 family)